MTQDDKPSDKPALKSIDAVRHVGRTLESVEERAFVPKADQLSPEDQAAAEDELNIYTLSESGGEKPELKKGAEPEPLKTRLPGDSSSDPHTDVETDLGGETPRHGA